MKNAEKTAREQVGDGKLPNRYWVCIHSDWLEQSKEHEYESARDLHPDMPAGKESKTFGPYATFRGAIKKAEELIQQEIGEPGLGDYQMVTIEDRISGTIWEGTYTVYKKQQGIYEILVFDFGRNDDSQYTRDEMAERGVEFE